MSVSSQQKPTADRLHVSVSVEVSEPVLGLGEIRTGLLPHSGPLPVEATTDLLTTNPGRLVRCWERPVRHVAASPSLTGVDCWMPSSTGRRMRGVGTLGTEVRITGGQVVQAHTQSLLHPTQQKRRLPWSYYLTHPGSIEAWGRIRADEIADAFFGQDAADDGVLDLGGPTAHRLNQIRSSALLDRRQTYRPEQIRLRWVATATNGPPFIRFTLRSRQVHTLLLQVPAELLPSVHELCLDVALHDWLLFCLLNLIERAGIGSRSRAEVVATLAPAVDHLLHAWLPGARLGPSLMPLWAEIDRFSGMSRQWDSAVARLRDQVALAAFEQATRQHPQSS